MRVTCPTSFSVAVSGPEGRYELYFEPQDAWDGLITTTIGGIAMDWNVDMIEADQMGNIAISGLTRGSEPLWNDCFWFELRLGAEPEIAYWGNQVLWRTDPVTILPAKDDDHAPAK